MVPGQSRVLLVGAGGIGCELLKNLLLTGFGEMHIIDLDTIDLSNLNRQFLFRHEHIKKPKALVCGLPTACSILANQLVPFVQVAKEVAGKFRPDTKLEAYHANIKDAQFNIDWFKTFNIVFNALDNLDARRHVNRMCLAANVPLVESGTTGFNGQVQVIKKVRQHVRMPSKVHMINVPHRTLQSATIAIQRRPQRPFQFARYAARRASRYTA